MRVLDLDLDFFQDEIAYWCNPVKRLSEKEFTPWNEIQVRLFLEQKCGLRMDRPIRGRTVRHHHEAFLYWRELISQGRLTSPFEVVHVDAHADLGMGDGGYEHLMADVLHWELGRRQHPIMDNSAGCGLGNYLAFAIGCRWLSKLVFVNHPKWSDDLFRFHFKNWDKNSGQLQLMKIDRTQTDEMLWGKGYSEFQPLAFEPEVPFIRTEAANFLDDGSFDRIVLCHSPGYTPPASDQLIPIIESYMIPE